MKKNSENVEIAFLCVACLWVVYFLSVFLPFDLQSHGIRPRRIAGLEGLVFAPFLHAGLGHLISNSLALGPLLFLALAYSRRETFETIVFTALLGGGATWLLGAPNSLHIGASGIIFGLLGYLLGIGLFRRELFALILSIVVASYYGYALFSLFVVMPGVSWTGHFFGFAAGVLAAGMSRKKK
ncbi:MAG: rhomboid family intramembrane serine protease [Desulfobacteraceae bacterium]|nr:rhomboid family intramembrane serine protease [Desulfobacteraceae bacterium]